MSPCLAKSTDCQLNSGVSGSLSVKWITGLTKVCDPHVLTHADLSVVAHRTFLTGTSTLYPLKSCLSLLSSRWSASLARRCPVWPSAAARTGTSGRGCTSWGRCCSGGSSGSDLPPSPPSCRTRRPWTPAGDTWTWIWTAASPAAFWGEFKPNKLGGWSGLHDWGGPQWVRAVFLFNLLNPRHSHMQVKISRHASIYIDLKYITQIKIFDTPFMCICLVG